MSRLTRNSIILSEENIDNNVETPKKKRGRPKKRQSVENASPILSKSPKTKSEPLSPTTTLANDLNDNLNVTNKFRAARRAFTDNSKFKLPGREAQFDELTKLLNEIIETKASASIYINGPPGKFKF